jgi:hypothetical protein
MVIDEKQRLHVVYQRPDGLWHLQASLGKYGPQWLRQQSD